MIEPDLGLVLCEQSQYLLHGKVAVNDEVDLDSGLWTRPIELNAALRYVTFIYLYHIALAVSKNSLYTTQDGWNGFAQYALQANKLPAVLLPHSSSVVTVLGVTRALLPAKNVIDFVSMVPKLSNEDVMVAETLPHPVVCRTSLILYQCASVNDQAR